MAAFARWTNLSETTFLLPPTDAGADYRVRIFTPGGELPFAGHPTLGSCHAWLAAGGRPKQPGVVVQQCGVGLVSVRRDGERLAFAAPPLRRSGPLDAALLRRCARCWAWTPMPCAATSGWTTAPAGARCCSIRPSGCWRCSPTGRGLGELKLGLVGAHPSGGDAQFELRALIGGGSYEDPVTGSLNASVAQWLIGARLAPPRYVAAQGTVLQRAGRVYIDSEGGTVWVGGDVSECIRGEVEL